MNNAARPSDILDRIVDKAFGEPLEVGPRLPSVFEPHATWSGAEVEWRDGWSRAEHDERGVRGNAPPPGPLTPARGGDVSLLRHDVADAVRDSESASRIAGKAVPVERAFTRYEERDSPAILHDAAERAAYSASRPVRSAVPTVNQDLTSDGPVDPRDAALPRDESSRLSRQTVARSDPAAPGHSPFQPTAASASRPVRSAVPTVSQDLTSDGLADPRATALSRDDSSRLSRQTAARSDPTALGHSPFPLTATDAANRAMDAADAHLDPVSARTTRMPGARSAQGFEDGNMAARERIEAAENSPPARRRSPETGQPAPSIGLDRAAQGALLPAVPAPSRQMDLAVPIARLRQAAETVRAGAHADTPSIVNVTIGRIEVRAAGAPASAPRPEGKNQRRPLSLQDYLKRRSEQ